MSKFFDRKLRFSDAAFAIDTTPKSLRNWLQRKQVKLTTSEESGWRAFNLADIAILALVRQMVDFGMGVEEASDFANVIVMGHEVTYASHASDFSLAIRFIGERLIFWKIDSEWQIRIIDSEKTSQTEYPECFASIALCPVIAKAIQRALLGTEKPESDEEKIKATIKNNIISLQEMTDSLKGDANEL